MAKKLTHPSPKVIETYEMLKSGKSVTVETMASRLNCKPGTLMVHICQMRGHFNAIIETERDGRKVVSYLLKNPAEVAPFMVGKTKTPKAAKPKATLKVSKSVSRVATPKSRDVPTIDSDFDVSEVTDAELADLKNQLGIGS